MSEKAFANFSTTMTQWKRVSNEYCDSAPVMLLGLKSDLRPRFFTLKLMHLNEPNATTMGQVCCPLHMGLILPGY